MPVNIISSHKMIQSLSAIKNRRKFNKADLKKNFRKTKADSMYKREKELQAKINFYITPYNKKISKRKYIDYSCSPSERSKSSSICKDSPQTRWQSLTKVVFKNKYSVVEQLQTIKRLDSSLNIKRNTSQKSSKFKTK